MLDSIPFEGQKLMPWPGLHPQKFQGNRRHIRPQDQLNGYEGAPLPLLGRKHYQQKYSAVGEYKPHLKVFPNISNKTTDLSTLTTGGLKKLAFIPPQRKLRAEKLHLYAKKSNRFENKSVGIRTLEIANQRTTNQYEHEKQQQTKTRIDGQPPMKNQLDASEKQLTNMRAPCKMTWKERERIDELREDKRQVDELDAWEQNTLKQAFPNRKDPEKFFDNEDLTGSSNAKGKGDNKKGLPSQKKK